MTYYVVDLTHDYVSKNVFRRLMSKIYFVDAFFFGSATVFVDVYTVTLSAENR